MADCLDYLTPLCIHESMGTGALRNPNRCVYCGQMLSIHRGHLSTLIFVFLQIKPRVNPFLPEVTLRHAALDVLAPDILPLTLDR